MSEAAKPSSTRVRQAAVFVGGALVLWLASFDFLWTPFLLGLVYLAAALVGGRRGGHWSTACVLLGWGAAVLVLSETSLGVGDAPAYLAGAGLGALAAAALERAGVGADLPGVAGALALAGLVFTAAGEWEELGRVEPYAAALALVAAVNLALALRAQWSVS